MLCLSSDAMQYIKTQDTLKYKNIKKAIIKSLQTHSVADVSFFLFAWRCQFHHFLIWHSHLWRNARELQIPQLKQVELTYIHYTDDEWRNRPSTINNWSQIIIIMSLQDWWSILKNWRENGIISIIALSPLGDL